MEKIFYTTRTAYSDTNKAIKALLAREFGVENAHIVRSETGKPYLAELEQRLFFSVSHTNERLFIAFSDENVGLDAEYAERSVAYQAIVKKFPVDERKEILSSSDFLRHWTVKEAAIKWLGGSLAHDLYKLSYTNDNLLYGEVALPRVYIRTFEKYILALCGERDFSQTEILPF